MPSKGSFFVVTSAVIALFISAPVRADDSHAYWSSDYEPKKPSLLSDLGLIFHNALTTITQSDTLQDVEHLGSVFNKGQDAAGNSILNLPQIVNVVGSDLSAVAELPFHALDRQSQRIEVCAVNVSAYDLPVLEQVDPDFHVGVVFDRGSMGNAQNFSTVDPGMVDGLGGRANATDVTLRSGFCQPVFFKDKISESMAIERVNCIARHYLPHYRFWMYNCGGFTDDILKASGLSERSQYNVGIGSAFRKNTDAAQLTDVTTQCDAWIGQIPALLTQLESGAPINESALSQLIGPKTNADGALYFDAQNNNDTLDQDDGAGDDKLITDDSEPSAPQTIIARTVSVDLAVQLAVSVTRGHNPQNSAWLKQRLLFQSKFSWTPTAPLSIYYKPNTHTIRKEVVDSLKAILVPLTSDEASSLQQNFPDVAQLYQDFNASVH